MDAERGTPPGVVRNLAGFWLLGLCNNFAYVIMLSAAHDILHPLTPDANVTNATTVENRTGKLVEYCNPIGTGAILLADILPALMIKLAAPLYIHLLPYSFKVWVVVVLAGASFPMVAFGGSEFFWLTIAGVIFASAGSGIGEVTFLSLTSHFGKNCVSTWSSGTGAAGVFGALSYAGLTALGFSPRNSLLLMLIIPVALALTYFLLLVRPATVSNPQLVSSLAVDYNVEDADRNLDTQPLFEPEVTVNHSRQVHSQKMSFIQRLLLVKPLLKFMIPLLLVYFAEYFINQGLFELLYFKNAWLPRMQQYRWYQVIYQIGVFISRSSVNVVNIPFISIFPIFQFVNLTLLTCQVFYNYIPNIWIVFVIILFEGLMGGGAYVNTFYRISKEVPAEHREFSLGVTSISDSFGISLAAVISIPVHDYICSL